MSPRRHLPPILLLSGLAIALLLAASAWPQEQQNGTVLRLTTRIVNVNVVVSTADGVPVRGLKQEDFTVLDGGDEQKIAFFDIVDNVAAPSAPLGPDTYSNRPEEHGALPSATVLLFDALNTRWTAQANALQQVRTLLRQIQPQDHIGIYVLGDDLKVVHELTGDASDLVEAMRRYDEKHSHSPSKPAAGDEESTGNPDLDRFLAGKDNRYRYELSGRRATPGYAQDKLEYALSMTTASMEAIARELSSFPGRKSLIWVASSLGIMGYLVTDDLNLPHGSWPGLGMQSLLTIPSSQDFLDLERMIRLMNDSGIAVYTVDARQLSTSNSQYPSTPMLELAARTGGRAFFNRNDLELGMRRALDDSRFSYSLAYYPTHNRWKGEWRKIQVKVNRPGSTVLTRSGYFALPDAAPIPPKNHIEFLSQIAASPVESTQVPLTVQLAAASAADGAHLTARVHFDVMPMLTRQRNGRWTGNFEVVFMQIGDKQKLLDATTKDVSADLDDAQYAAMARRGTGLSADLKFMPGARLLCVILHDKGTEAAGSVRIPLARYAASLGGI